MMDPVGSVKQVLQVALKIKEAVDTVRHNKELCHQIRGRVNRLRAILSKLEDADAVNDPTTADTLKDLEETLHRAYSLVAACQEDKNVVSLLFTAGKLSRKLRQVNDDILAQMAIASFGNNVRTTIMLTKHFQDTQKEDAEHVMSWSGTHLFHEDRGEESHIWCSLSSGNNNVDVVSHIKVAEEAADVYEEECVRAFSLLTT
ncbi:hypothetical protein QYE76_037944 [Lolium multiflorum]|uniref:Mixed lineage kinase domain-containing protein n=1 Tax=Lolium multiflorum TaxID=4521 RepID=A0AAD8T8M9_LOLMU|nr:hypothetical protein QYE76_037944 [Lolium multiflorum]